jgi:hypothetical protein
MEQRVDQRVRFLVIFDVAITGLRVSVVMNLGGKSELCVRFVHFPAPGLGFRADSFDSSCVYWHCESFRVNKLPYPTPSALRASVLWGI